MAATEPVPDRAGISLLEVLISIFVLTVGLLGIAAVIPIGRVEILQTQIADRSSTLGRDAHRELYVREYLNPNHWLVLWPDDDVADPWPPSSTTAIVCPNWFRPAVAGESFAIDPLYIARNINSYPPANAATDARSTGSRIACRR